MHPKIAERRSGVLDSQALASEHLIIEKIGRIESLFLSVDKTVAGSGHFEEVLEFCRTSRAAILASSPFSGEGRAIRAAVGRGFAELGHMMCETAEGLRRLKARTT